MPDPVEKITRILQDMLKEGMSPLEVTLMVSQSCREAYGGEWQIEALNDGGFVVKKTG